MGRTCICFLVMQFGNERVMNLLDQQLSFQYLFWPLKKKNPQRKCLRALKMKKIQTNNTNPKSVRHIQFLRNGDQMFE